jgi:hypothetical protein
MNANVFEELTWSQFKQLREIKTLSEREQIKRYNFYLDQLNTARFQNWYNSQPKGPRGTIIIEEGFLQQEDLFYILQEDGSFINVTIEI